MDRREKLDGEQRVNNENKHAYDVSFDAIVFGRLDRLRRSRGRRSKEK